MSMLDVMLLPDPLMIQSKSMVSESAAVPTFSVILFVDPVTSMK